MFHVKHLLWQESEERGSATHIQRDQDQTFVLDLLTTLRAERYRPRAWWNFLARSWRMSLSTARVHPGLVRSWLRVTLLNGGLALLVLLLNFTLEGPGSTWRLLPGFLFCVAWQQSDLFWHLGLNRRVRTGELLPTLGLPAILTGWRGLCASYLLGRLFGGINTPSTLALGVFLLGVATDILDGPLARLTHTQSRLGQIADGEADCCLYLALVLILAQNGFLPLWLGLLMLLRFLLPLLAALLSYFLFARPARFGSTSIGRLAGLAQCLYFLLLLAPSVLASLTHPLQLPLLIATIVLLVFAPVAQILVNLHQRVS